MTATQTDRLAGLTTSVAVKAPCRVATTANHALSGLAAIDGVTPVEGDRVLVKNQTDATENGIYNASASDWSRALDFNGSLDAVNGTTVFVDNSGGYFRLVADDPVVFGTSELAWQFVGAVLSVDEVAIPSVGMYGALTPAATAAASLALAASSVGRGGLVYAEQEIDVGTAAPTAPGGDFIGQHSIFHDAADDHGGVIFNKIARNPFLLRWGPGSVSKQFLDKVKTGAAAKVILIGDSNTLVYWGATLARLLAGLPGVTVVNNAVSGSTLSMWYNDTGLVNGTGKDFASTMTANPDLIIDGYGSDTNGPLNGGTAASFDTLMPIVYAAIRAHTNGGTAACGIVTVTGQPQRAGGAMIIEGGAKQDELHEARIRPTVQRVCAKYGSAMFDLRQFFDDPAMLDLGSDLHLQNSAIDMAGHGLFEWLIPSVYRGGGPILISDRSWADLPVTFPDGRTMCRMEDAPNDGITITTKMTYTNGLAYVHQKNFKHNAPLQFVERHSVSGTSWGNTQYTGQTDVAAITPASGYTNPATSAGLNVRRDGGMSSLKGMMTKDTPATIAAGVTLGTIPADYRPPHQITGVVVTCRDGASGVAGAYEHIFASIETNGTIVTRSAAASTVTGIHINASFRFA